MAAPIFSSAVNKFGRTIFRKAGRFISESTFRQGTRAVAQQFRKRDTGRQPNLAKLLMDTIGPPIGGGNWVSRVRQSASRFQELLGDNNELG